MWYTHYRKLFSLEKGDSEPLHNTTHKRLEGIVLSEKVSQSNTHCTVLFTPSVQGRQSRRVKRRVMVIRKLGRRIRSYLMGIECQFGMMKKYTAF